MKRINTLIIFSLMIFTTSVIGQVKFNSVMKSNTQPVKVSDNKIAPIIKSVTSKNFSKLDRTVSNSGGSFEYNGIQVMREGSRIVLPVIIKAANVGKAQTVIANNGGKVYTTAGNILTAKIPANNIRNVSNNNSIIYIDASYKREFLLNTSRGETKANYVHIGHELPREYKGEGVIVGVVDSGIDWEHPDFSDEDGTRIQYIWDQTGQGNSPQNFDYGSEWTKEQIDDGESTQIDVNGHGTHVTGTAAGNGSANTDFVGMAPESDIVFVKININTSQDYLLNGGFDFDVLNGCSYIFEKAEELGKPAVINLSLGSHVGAHDGSSNLELGLNNLSGPGRIIAVAAGNEGTDLIHSTAELHEGDDPKQLMFEFGGDTQSNVVDLWYEGDSISVFLIGTYFDDDTTFSFYYSEQIDPGEVLQDYYIDEGDTTLAIQVDASTLEYPNNGMRRILVGVVNATQDTIPPNVIFTIALSGKGEYHAWSLGSDFLEDDSPNVLNPDRFMTIGNPATAERVLCVGSYATKSYWVDVNGQDQFFDYAVLDSVSVFSSVGPTLDGRVKPDIVAPGQFIGAAYSDHSLEIEASHILPDSNLTMMQGTSMATPHIAGITALLLEANPELTPEEVRDILQTTAVKDDYTGEVPNNFYGMGKVDALAAMQNVVTSVESDNIPKKFSLSQNYPNPFNPVTKIKYQVAKESQVTLRIYNILGQEIATLVDKKQKPGLYNVEFGNNIEKQLSSGVYLYRLKAGDFVSSKKMMLLK